MFNGEAIMFKGEAIISCITSYVTLYTLLKDC